MAKCRHQAQFNMQWIRIHNITQSFYWTAIIPTAVVWKPEGCCCISWTVARLHQVLLFTVCMGQSSRDARSQEKGLAYPTITGAREKIYSNYGWQKSAALCCLLFSSTTLYEFWLAQLFLYIVSSLAPSASNSSLPTSTGHFSRHLPVLIFAFLSVLLRMVSINIWPWPLFRLAFFLHAPTSLTFCF
jgi:hypothetical protein